MGIDGQESYIPKVDGNVRERYFFEGGGGGGRGRKKKVKLKLKTEG